MAISGPVHRGSVTDKSITSISGSSQQLVADNNRRNYLFIQNVGAASMGINVTGGTAAIGGTGTMTLTAGSYKEWIGPFVPNNQVNIIGTATQTIICWEG